MAIQLRSPSVSDFDPTPAVAAFMESGKRKRRPNYRDEKEYLKRWKPSVGDDDMMEIDKPVEVVKVPEAEQEEDTTAEEVHGVQRGANNDVCHNDDDDDDDEDYDDEGFEDDYSDGSDNEMDEEEVNRNLKDLMKEMDGY